MVAHIQFLGPIKYYNGTKKRTSPFQQKLIRTGVSIQKLCVYIHNYTISFRESWLNKLLMVQKISFFPHEIYMYFENR